jgi:hypothetical protein
MSRGVCWLDVAHGLVFIQELLRCLHLWFGQRVGFTLDHIRSVWFQLDCMILGSRWQESMGSFFREDYSVATILFGYFRVFWGTFLCHFDGPFLGHISSIDLCKSRFFPLSCQLPEDGLESPRWSVDLTLSPVDLQLKVVQPWVPENDTRVSEIGNEKRLDLLFFSLSNS